MDYKEKYEQALSVAKETYNTQPMYRAWLKKMFSELAESEDEKIRKTLIRVLNENVGNGIEKYGAKLEEALAWLEKQGDKDKFIEKELGCIKGYRENAIKRLDELEKQGEQNDSDVKDYNSIDPHFGKTIDKVEPKFKVGDWVILTAGELSTTLQIVNVDTNKKLYWFNDSSYLPIVYEECLHLWTIQDAKDGDVLWHSDTASHGTFIFKQIRYDGKVLCYCDYDSEDHFCTGEHHTCCWSSDKCIKPATNEQRELLFQKMHEAGYEWDFKKKDLKKINSYCQENCKGFQETGKCFADGECKTKRETEQRPTQEIEPFEAEHGKYYYCIKDYFCGGRKQASKGDVIQALRGLSIMGLKDASEYFLPVNYIKCNFAWSEEEECYICQLESIVKERWALAEKAQDAEVIKNMSDLAFFLKTLNPNKKPTDEEMKALLRTEYEKGRADAFAEMQKEWSEEDEKILRTILSDGIRGVVLDMLQVNWLKSLKPQPKQEWSEEDLYKIEHALFGTYAVDVATRLLNKIKSLRPQNRWKPSDEQMRALKHAFNDGSITYKEMEILGTLYEQLKALHHYEWHREG